MDKLSGSFDITKEEGEVFILFGKAKIKSDNLRVLSRAVKQVSIYSGQRIARIDDSKELTKVCYEEDSPECIVCGSSKYDKYITVSDTESDYYNFKFCFHEKCSTSFMEFLHYLIENPEDYIQYYI